MTYNKTIVIRQYLLALKGLMCAVVLLILSNVMLLAQTHPLCNVDQNKISVKAFGQRMATENILYIPVVFHIVYNQANQNLSDQIVFEQLNSLNKDFNKENADSVNTLPIFLPAAGKSKIRFVLANNASQSGIVRVQTSHGPFFNDDLHQSATGGSDAWNIAQYLNIWVANLGDGVLGYASTPDSQLSYDGVAIHFQYFGKGQHTRQPFDQGRTLTHEVGHWLGLSHPWADGGCASDDGVQDTPPQDAATGGCALSYTSCGQLAMVQNFMSLSDDACMNLFTKGQIEIMRNVLVTNKSDMLISPELITGVGKERKERILISPNPTSTYLNIMVTGEQNLSGSKAEIIDQFGRICFEEKNKIEHSMYTLVLPYLREGVYTLRLTLGQMIQQERLLILHH